MLGCGTKLCVFICIRHEFFIFYFLCWVVKLNCAWLKWLWNYIVCLPCWILELIYVWGWNGCRKWNWIVFEMVEELLNSLKWWWEIWGLTISVGSGRVGLVPTQCWPDSGSGSVRVFLRSGFKFFWSGRVELGQARTRPNLFPFLTSKPLDTYNQLLSSFFPRSSR